jgi:hypothetical protein
VVNVSDMSFVPLQQANLCLDCETISAAPSTCLACGSRAILNIARALNKLGYPSSSCPAAAVNPALFRKEVTRTANFADST